MRARGRNSGPEPLWERRGAEEEEEEAEAEEEGEEEGGGGEEEEAPARRFLRTPASPIAELC